MLGFVWAETSDDSESHQRLSLTTFSSLRVNQTGAELNPQDQLTSV